MTPKSFLGINRFNRSRITSDWFQRCSLIVVGCMIAAWVGARGQKAQLTVLLLLLGIGVAVQVARRPAKGVVVALAIAPLLPLYLVFGLPLVGTPSLLAWLGLIALGSALIALLRAHRQDDGATLGPLDLMIAAKGVQSNVIWHTIVSNFTLTSALRTILILSGEWYLAALVANRLGRSQRWIQMLINGLILSATVQSLIALVEAGTGFRLMPFLLDRLLLLRFFLSASLGETAYSRMIRNDMFRVKGTFHQSIDLGWYLGLMLILAIGGWSLWGQRLPISARILVIGLLTAGLLATLSGTPFLATLIGVAVLVGLLPGVRRLRVLAIATILVLTGLLLLTAAPSLQGTATVVQAFFQSENEVYLYGGVGPNTQGRILAYSKLWPLVLESPVWGHGYFLGEANAVSIYRDITSRYLIELIEEGGIGLLFFLLPVGFALSTVVRVRFTSQEIWIRTFSATLIAMLVQCLAMNFVKNRGGVVEMYYWLTIGLASATSYLGVSLSSPQISEDGR